MPAFIREAVALVVLAINFLVLELQTQVSRFQRILPLQHLKKSRRKRLILLQIVLRKTRRARRACSWPRNQYWFESLLHGNFVQDWWKENFRIPLPLELFVVARIYVFVFCHDSYIKNKRENEVAKTCSNETDAIWTPRDVKYYATASGYICHLDLGYRPKPCLIAVLIELLPWLTFCCLGRHLPWYQLVFTHAKYLPRLVDSNTLVRRSSVNTATAIV